MDYKADQYADLVEQGTARPYWSFLNVPDNVVRMETATFLGRPAVEPLSPYLLSEFGEAAREHRHKQMIGHMVRQIMTSRGYATERSNVRIPQPNLFASGTRYRMEHNLEGTDMTNREVGNYGRFTLISGVLNGKARAVAFLKNRKVLECEGADTEEALASIKGALDARQQTRSRKRREPHIGTVDDYTDAFSALSLAEHERRMLYAHANAQGRTMTATELAQAGGYDSYTAANSLYGTLGKKVAEIAGLALKPAETRDDVVYTCALASGVGEEGQHWKWTMHPELFEALRSLNIV
jgi:hypothetical protein